MLHTSHNFKTYVSNICFKDKGIFAEGIWDIHAEHGKIYINLFENGGRP
jgi:hypothetical protein